VEPLSVALILAGAVAVFCLVASLITRDYSWVDRIWSIVPVAYVWIFAGASMVAGAPDPRLILMALLVTAWGARLTFNFARKGGYSGTEDYRWPVLRARMSPAAFQVFNVLFIVAFQNALLLLIALPAQIAWQSPARGLTVADGVLAVLFAACLLGETLADQQQWDFHKRKAAEAAAGRSVTPGFLTTGLWRYSRHPNFFFEQAQWWLFYGFSVVAVSAASGFVVWGGLVNWTLVAPVLLSILFIGSTRFTESISSSKYPEYAEYQRTTSMLVPMPSRAEPTGLGHHA